MAGYTPSYPGTHETHPSKHKETGIYPVLPGNKSITSTLFYPATSSVFAEKEIPFLQLPSFMYCIFLNDVQLIQCLWTSSKHPKHLGSLRCFQNAENVSLKYSAIRCRLNIASLSPTLGVSSWLITVNCYHGESWRWTVENLVKRSY